MKKTVEKTMVEYLKENEDIEKRKKNVVMYNIKESTNGLLRKEWQRI